MPYERKHKNEEKDMYSIFQGAYKFYCAPAWLRVARSPIKFLYAKSLQILADTYAIAVKRKAQLFWGESIGIILPEIVSYSIFRFGFFEVPLTVFLLEYLKPGMTCIDVGAHCGYVSMLSAHLVGSTGQVHSFEPTPSTFKWLESNVKAYPNIHINQNAVWSCQSRLTLHDFGIRYAALNSLYAPRLSQRIKGQLQPVSREVAAVSLDTYVRSMSIEPALIKIDAESAEYEILQGMREILSTIQPALIIEVGDLDVKGAAMSRDVIDFLVQSGYCAIEFRDGKFQKHQIQQSYESGTLFFLPVGDSDQIIGVPRCLYEKSSNTA